jgi:exonuclease SbcD
MKLLHTSDWHLGRNLYTKKRYEEFSQFLTWLVEQIKLHQPDALIVAGDIFDTTTPSNRAQELYYKFLCQVSSTTNCMNVIIIGGNHDSASLLNAPQALLKQLNIYVIGHASSNLADEVIELKNIKQQIIGLVCAIPYLRDKDIRQLSEQETAQQKDLLLMEAIRQHYQRVIDLANNRRQELNLDIPLIATGHLFVTGGKTLKDDGVRELYIGSLAQFGANDFPHDIDYLALGHLHSPQQIANQAHWCYSGAPLAMSFAEAKQTKVINLVEFEQRKAIVSHLPIPCFQRLERISGDLTSLQIELAGLVKLQQSIWVEINYTGNEIIANLAQILHQMVENSSVELVKIINHQLIDRVLSATNEFSGVELNDLTPEQVFAKCLELNEIDLTQSEDLRLCFNEILEQVAIDDANAG